MKEMSDYISHLENFNDLEVSVIRATKINKLFKAIFKMESIPREDEFNFKGRSRTLLDKWNKLLASDGAATNGVNGSTESKAGEKEAKADSEKADSEEPAKEGSDQKAKIGTDTKSDSPAAEEKNEEVCREEKHSLNAC